MCKQHVINVWQHQSHSLATHIPGLDFHRGEHFKSIPAQHLKSMLLRIRAFEVS